ncbi:hypothetical protein RM844_16900 [Streptomyces sp. DSM 44915]|uniref:Uncharacterized protein n=1 Tax=Streptomyces chisholmiae TaxID=3075540 RepID=A0ABU2JSJ0_9ACTN|nr:hypothetical protein [Streptomyces sp. DSM 44915]MDT0267960.1 hypothetical protein [Streptomyces sp. DSM 44915]
MATSPTRNAPTVLIRTEVYLHDDEEGRWVWQSAAPLLPDAREYVYSEEELDRTINVYGRLVARIFQRSARVQRFRVQVHGVACGISSNLLGVFEWKRSAETDRLIPAQEPTLLWTENVKLLASCG